MMPADDYYARCVSLYEQDQLTEADDLARDGLSHYPVDGRLWQVHGVTRWRRQDLEAARSALETASCLVPLLPVAQCALAGSYARLGQAEAALTIYRFLVDEDGICPTGLLELVAAGLCGLHAYDVALRAYERLTAAAPQHARGHAGMAACLTHLGMPPAAALGPLEKAHDLARDNLRFRLELAALYVRLARLEPARELMSKVSPRQVACPMWLARMMQIYEALGDMDAHRACEQQLDRQRR